MKTIYKALIGFVVVALLVGLFFRLAGPNDSASTTPERIPGYAEAVPADFTAPAKSHVVDIRDAQPLMQPRLGVVKVADNIVLAACPDKHPECVARSLFLWTRTAIEHKDALLAREHLLGPEETILYREADDETISILLASLLLAENLPARIGYTPYVTFVETQVDNRSVRLDPACASCAYGDTRYQGSDEKIVWVG